MRGRQSHRIKQRYASSISVGELLLYFTVAIGAFSALYFFLAPYGLNGSIFRREWGLCLKYLAQGALYGGQPFCVQQPLFFLTLGLLNALFPYPHFLPLQRGLDLTFSAGTLVLLALLLKRKTGRSHFWFLLAPYLFLIYYRLSGDTPAILALFFFALATVLLFGRCRAPPWFAGMFLGLACFFKISFSIPAFFLVLAFLWGSLRAVGNRQNRQSLAVLKRIVQLALPPVLLYSLLLFLFPYFPYYAIFAATKVAPHPLLQTVMKIFGTNLLNLNFFNFTSYAILLIAALLAWRRRGPLSLVALLSLFVLLFLTNMQMEEGFIRFLAPGYFLTLLVACSEFPLNTLGRKLLFCGISLLLILPYAVSIGMGIQQARIRELVEEPLQFLPEQHGPIIGEGESEEQYRAFISTFYPYALDKLEVYRTPYLIDYGVLPGLTYYGVVRNFSQWTNTVPSRGNQHFYLPREDAVHNRQLFQRMRNGTYDLIIIGPPSWEIIYPDYLRASNMTMPDGSASPLKGYCPVHVPYFLYFDVGNSTKDELFLFRNTSECNNFRWAIANYYVEHFSEICKLDFSLWAFIYRQALPASQISIEGNCTSTGNFVERYQLMIKKFDTYPWT